MITQTALLKKAPPIPPKHDMIECDPTSFLFLLSTFTVTHIKPRKCRGGTCSLPRAADTVTKAVAAHVSLTVS